MTPLNPRHENTTLSDSQTVTTFKALVEALVPNLPALASYGEEYAAGAVELDIQYKAKDLSIK